MKYGIQEPVNNSTALLIMLTAETAADRLFLGRVAQKYKFKPGGEEKPVEKIVVDVYNLIAQVGCVTVATPDVTEVRAAKALADAEKAAPDAPDEAFTDEM